MPGRGLGPRSQRNELAATRALQDAVERAITALPSAELTVAVANVPVYARACGLTGGAKRVLFSLFSSSFGKKTQDTPRTPPPATLDTAEFY